MKKKPKKPLLPRLPLEWVLGKGTKEHKDKSVYQRKPKHKKSVGEEK